MTAILPLVVLVPILAGAVSLLLARRRIPQRLAGLLAVSAALAGAVGLLVAVGDGDVVSVQLGGWGPRIGITLAVDTMSAMFLTVALATILGVLLFAIGQGADEAHPFVFHPVYMILTAGVAAAFVTADLFTMYVAFEIVLISSYVLLTLGGRADQVRTGMTYVVMNHVASTVFLAVIGLVYAATGTVNMGLLAERIPELPDGIRLTLGVLLLLVFGMKAAIFPLFFWLPDSYPTAPTAITAVFAGLLTKVGVYAILRTQTLFGYDDLAWLVLVLAGCTMIVGVLGAIAQDDMKRILSFHIVSQIGYMLMGLGLFTVAGVAGSILFVVHQIPVKTSLFLVGGVIEQRYGTSALRKVDGVLHTMPLIAALFLLSALSLAGLPPFSGFVAKLALVEAGIGIEAWVIVAVSLVGSLLTLFSMTKIWSGVFWGSPPQPSPVPAPSLPVASTGASSTGAGTNREIRPALMVGAACAVVALTVAIALAAGPLWEMSEHAAGLLLSPGPYIEAVTGR